MELIDALCVLKMGWKTDDEHKLFIEASEVIAKRVEYLRDKMKYDKLTSKMVEWLKTYNK